MGDGLALAADPVAIGDAALVRARGCDFSLAGCVGSARGRDALYALGSAVYGHFEGALGGTRYRFTKAGGAVYKNGVSFDTTFTSTGNLTGVSYNGWVYLADGTTLARYDGTTVTPWGLDPPGYLALGADPISTVMGDATVTVTLPAGHDIAALDFVEIRQATEVGGLAASEFNRVVYVTGVTATSMTFEASVAAPQASASGGGNYVIIVAGPNVVVTAGTSTFATGRYGYAYTFWNGACESNFSAIVYASAAGVATDLDTSLYASIDTIRAGPSGTISRRIYRTDVNGSALFFLREIDGNAETAIVDFSKLMPGAKGTATPGSAVTTDTSPLPEDSDVDTRRRPQVRGGSLMGGLWQEQRRNSGARREAPEVQLTNLGYLADWLDHDPPPDDIEGLFLLDEQLFGMSGNGIVFSLTGQPEHFPPFNKLIPGLRSSGTLRAALPLDRDVIAYTDEGIHRITKVGLSFEDSRMEAVESPVGLVGKYAVAALDGIVGHVFLAKDGLYYFDGAKPIHVSGDIDPMFTDSGHEDYVNPSYMSTARIVASRRTVWMSYGVSAANDRLLVADVTVPTAPKFFVMEWSLTMLVREAASGAIIAGDSSGNVYTLDTGWTDDGAAIDWLVKTKRYPMNGSLVPGEANQLYLDADFAGATTTVRVTAYGAADDKTFTFTVATTGRQRVKKRLPVWMVGETMDVEVESSAAARRQLFAVGIEDGTEE